MTTEQEPKERAKGQKPLFQTAYCSCDPGVILDVSKRLVPAFDKLLAMGTICPIGVCVALSCVIAGYANPVNITEDPNSEGTQFAMDVARMLEEAAASIRKRVST